MRISLDKRKNRELMLSGNLLTAIMVLAIPTVLNSLIQTMYNLTDTYWLGKIGTDELAAITLVSPAQSLIMCLGTGLTTAGSILMAQYIGAKDDKNAISMVNHLFVCITSFSIVCAALFYLFTPTLLRWMGATDLVYTYGKTYLQIVIWDMPFLFMINLYTSVNHAQGDALTPMLLNLLGVIINMILDPLLLVHWHLGTSGAAIATLVAKIPCAILAFISLRKKTNPIHLQLKGFHLEASKVKNILKIGIPTALGKSTMQLGFLLMSKDVLQYGAIAVSSYGIGNKINSVITMPVLGMGSATSTIVGQNFGAKQKDRALKTCQLTTIISVIFLIVSGIILSRPTISQAMVSIFTDDPKVIILGAEFLSILSLWSFSNGVYNTLGGLFQGSGHTGISVGTDVARLWLFRFSTLYFCKYILHMGVESIWYSVVISNALAALTLWIFYKMNLWRKDVIVLDSKAA